MTTSRREEAGFTLVELLVSLAILGMMSALLLQGLRTGWRVWDRVEARGHAGDTVLVAQSRLAGLIAGAVPQTSFTGSRPFARFEGTDRQVRFLTSSERGPQVVTLSLGADERLWLATQPDLARAGTPPPVTTTALLAGASALYLAYFGAAPPDNERRWRSRWFDQPTLPELVRVRLALADGDRHAWPDLIVHPAATVDTACVYVPATGRCKGRG